jgi:regulator of protease activity HflC (stomatin/prohibitin superfamily)
MPLQKAGIVPGICGERPGSRGFFMKKNNGFAVWVFVVVWAISLIVTYVVYRVTASAGSIGLAGAGFLVALIVAAAIQVADQWERVAVLRLGHFRAMKGPGAFLIIPVVDTVPYWIDTRVLTTTFTAERTLTQDTVPVDVAAVLFWQVIDPQKAALDVADYQGAIGWASQTALRDVIGKTQLADMLEGRQRIGDKLQEVIDERVEPWGIRVISVEIKDVLIPTALENAMSMQAQAERERQARVVLGDSERQVAEKFGEAAKTYTDNPTAFHLRAMNMLYEGLKQNATIVIVPSTAVESMQLGGIAGLTALTMGMNGGGSSTEGNGEPSEHM